jgi:rhamnose transport system ATP-binding protein
VVDVAQSPRTAAPGAVVLALDDVSKSFGAVAALRGAHLELRSGEAHALVGENGAGKSTLVKVLAGVHTPDTGRVLLDGQEVHLDSPAAARAAGIAVIYQEPTLFPDLSVAENIFMGRQPLSAGRRIDRRELHARCAALFERLGVRLDPERPARGLSIADQQMVEIAKALSFDARVLVMDEPTAAPPGVEVEPAVRRRPVAAGGGAAVLFISHRFDEVCRPLRPDHRHARRPVGLHRPPADLTVDQVVRRMVGP